MTRQLPVRVGYKYPARPRKHQVPCPHRKGVGHGAFCISGAYTPLSRCNTLRHFQPCGLQSVVGSPRGNDCIECVSGKSLRTCVQEVGTHVHSEMAKISYIGCSSGNQYEILNLTNHQLIGGGNTMGETFVCSLCRNGIIGGGLYIDEPCHPISLSLPTLLMCSW